MSFPLQSLCVDQEMGTRPGTLGGPTPVGVVTWRLVVAATVGQGTNQCLSLYVCQQELYAVWATMWPRCRV